MKTLYHDREYILKVLKDHDLLGQDHLRYIEEKYMVARRRGIDLIQWIDSLELPQKGKSTTLLTEAAILQAICQDQGWEFRRLDPLSLDINIVTRVLPASFAKRRYVLPIHQDTENNITVSCYYPGDKELIDDLQRVLKTRPILVVSPLKDINRVITEFFDFHLSIKAARSSITPAENNISNLEQYVKLSAMQGERSEKHINNAVDHLFQYALNERASDIHIEPRREETLIRFRIDGVLHVVYRLPREVHEAICTRIKALSRLDVAEKRRPQDGRIKVNWHDEDAEIRVSTVPVAFGEKVVLRIQNAEILFTDLDDLGFRPEDLLKYKKFLEHTYGIVLVTGPTGSGKSTTLYSTLRHLNSPELNIVTVEDPIEMVFEDFNQIGVQPAIGVTFSSILRNILRQDPDIVMIGEIRDSETARHSVQAALTGHMVFSTLHTNDSAGAITRLRDLGLESYLISSTLLGVVAQRLVRTICQNCKVSYTVPASKLESLGYRVREKEITLYRGSGCRRCRNTGYYGRTGVYEVLAVTDEIKKMIHQGEPELSIRKKALSQGMKLLRYDACRKMLAGITTMDEVIRATA